MQCVKQEVLTSLCLDLAFSAYLLLYHITNITKHFPMLNSDLLVLLTRSYYKVLIIYS